MQSVPLRGEEPNGTYYEYDRNLKATVKVTSDGERPLFEKLETSSLSPTRPKVRAKIAHEAIAFLSQQNSQHCCIIAGPVGAGKTSFYEAYLKRAIPCTFPR